MFMYFAAKAVLFIYNTSIIHSACHMSLVDLFELLTKVNLVAFFVCLFCA